MRLNSDEDFIIPRHSEIIDYLSIGQGLVLETVIKEMSHSDAGGHITEDAACTERLERQPVCNRLPHGAPLPTTRGDTPVRQIEDINPRVLVEAPQFINGFDHSSSLFVANPHAYILNRIRG